MKSLILILSLLAPALAPAHEGHKHSLTDTAKAAAVGALKSVEGAVVQGAAAVPDAAKAAQKIDWKALLKASLSSHRHNKIVHFPIAFGLLGVLFLLLSGKFESLGSPARWLLFLAALSAVAAVISGHGQEDSMDTPGLKQVMEVHEALGFWSMIGLWLMWILSFMPSTRKWRWVLLLILGLAILATGNLGGILAHMQL